MQRLTSQSIFDDRQFIQIDWLLETFYLDLNSTSSKQDQTQTKSSQILNQLSQTINFITCQLVYTFIQNIVNDKIKCHADCAEKYE